MSSILEHLTFVSDDDHTQQPKLIQKGGIGQVYLATATKNTYSTCCKKHSAFGLKAGNQYAVKFFTKAQGLRGSTPANKEDIIEVSTQVQGLCKVYFYDTLTDYDEQYIKNNLGIQEKLYEYCIMEYIDGPDLKDLIDSGRHFTDREIRSIIKQVLTTLSTLHDMGYCHRDVKLENVIYKRTAPASSDAGTNRLRLLPKSNNNRSNGAGTGASNGASNGNGNGSGFSRQLRHKQQMSAALMLPNIPDEVAKHSVTDPNFLAVTGDRNGLNDHNDRASPLQKSHGKRCILIDLDTVSSCQNPSYSRVGTDYYLSPELRNAYKNHEAVTLDMWRGGDRYALAVMIYELYHTGMMSESKYFASCEADIPDFKVPVSDNIRELYWALIHKGTKVVDSDYFLSLLDC